MNEREQILTSILKCRRVDLYVNAEGMTDSQEQQYKVMLQRRSQGEPLQYVIGHCDFLNTQLLVNESVLIPRPETELLVEMVVEKIQPWNRPIRILDLGTGSGNIAIALAKRVQECHVVSVDISRDAIAVARENAKRNFVEDKTTFVCCDMVRYLADQKECAEKFDVIISNPPYIKSEDIASLPADVLREPHIALDGGQDGLTFYREIVNQAHHVLKSDGHVYLEIGEEQAQSISALFDESHYYQNTSVFQDYADRDRFISTEFAFSKAVVN